MSARTRRDWVLAGALGCALVATFHAEYTLAVATGAHPAVALAVPGALDLYVIRALQMHREVFTAVLAMVVVNVASRLVTAGLLPVSWGLVSMVGALAPLVLWRVHALKREAAALGVGENVGPVTSEWDREWVPSWVSRVRVPELTSTPSAPHSDRTSVPERAPSAGALPSAMHSVTVPAEARVSEAVPVGVPVVPLPAGYVPAERVHLNPGDEAHLNSVRAYLSMCDDENRRPSVRGCMAEAKVGQERAGRIMQYLRWEERR